MDTPITRAEHLEFAKRMEEEHGRQNARIKVLEEKEKDNNRLLLLVERLATSMEMMQKEQKDQGERLEVLENRDGDMWRTIVKHAITVTVGIVIGYLFTQIGI